jgi:flagellar hook-length control protein FliK
MTQTNIDYLFQAIAPSTDRGSGPARTGGGSAGFDRHLNHASVSAFDLIQRPNNASDSPRPDVKSTDTARSTTHAPQDTSATSTEYSSEADENTNAAESACNRDSHDDCEHEKSDASEVAAAGVAQPTPPESNAKDVTSESEAAEEQLSTEEAKLAAEKKLAATTADGAQHKRQAKEKSAAEIPDGAESAALAVEAVEEDAAKTLEGAVEVEQQTNARTVARNKKANAKAATAEGAESDQQNGKGAATSQSEVTSPVAEAAVAAAEENVKAKAASADEETQDSSDDAGHDTKPSRTSNRGDGPTASNKADAAVIAANLLANVADAASNGDAREGADSAKGSNSKTDAPVGPLARAMRSATELTRGTNTANSNETPQIDPARFVGRVAKAFQTAQDRGGTLQLRLSPPELGSLKLQLTVKDGVMSASLETENHAARRVLLENLPALRDRLAEQNIRIERFDVDVRQENSSGQADPRGFQQNNYQQRPEHPEPRRPSVTQRQAAETVPAEDPSSVARITNTAINLVV